MVEIRKRYVPLRMRGSEEADLSPGPAVDDNGEDGASEAATTWRFARRSERIVSTASHALMLSLIATVVVFLAWASIFQLERVTRGAGKVLPYHDKQVVQHLEGGIITDIYVREGNIVKEGDVLLRIENQFARAELANTLLDLAAKRARLARLAAESEGAAAPTFPEDLLESHVLLIADEKRLFDKRVLNLQQQRLILQDQRAQSELELQELQARRQNLQDEFEILDRQVEMLDRLYRSRAGSESDLLAAKADAQRVKTRIADAEFSIPRKRAAIEELKKRDSEIVFRFRAKSEEEFTTVRTEIQQLHEAIRALQDRIKRSQIRSPIEGTINRLNVNTLGGVVQPGQDLVEIVPLDDSIVVEARIRPADRAEIWPGLPAVVKVSAYDYSIYGGLQGKVIDISPDAFSDEFGESYFRVRLEADMSSFGPENPVIPGMTATVDILTGEHTILSYLLKPVNRMREYALRQ